MRPAGTIMHVQPSRFTIPRNRVAHLSQYFMHVCAFRARRTVCVQARGRHREAAIRIDGLPKFTSADGLAVIEDRVLPAYEATHALLEFWKRHKARLRTAFET